ncbi:MAG TPA: response regulator transcription factor [Vicinamibacteria bacterium]|nr:response regulator transcription factor [Vicinamibacteria bacterium]
MRVPQILLADDHELVRKGLREVLAKRPDWNVCGEAVTGREAVSKAKELKPEVVILDVSMPELNGVEATREIVQSCPKTEVLVLTVHDSDGLIREILDAGARGYVLKSDATTKLVAAIESLLVRKPYFTSHVHQIVLEGYLDGVKPLKGEPLRRLTSRETQILQLLAEGRSNKEVASILDISVKTVETHRTNIMRKLGVHSVVELVRYAIKNEIIQA